MQAYIVDATLRPLFIGKSKPRAKQHIQRHGQEYRYSNLKKRCDNDSMQLTPHRVVAVSSVLDKAFNPFVWAYLCHAIASDFFMHKKEFITELFDLASYLGYIPRQIDVVWQKVRHLQDVVQHQARGEAQWI